MDGQKTQPGIEKHGRGMMMLLKELVRSENYEKTENRAMQREISKSKVKG